MLGRSPFCVSLLGAIYTRMHERVWFRDRGMPGVFATGGAGSLRVWGVREARELLRVAVPNFVCAALLFTHDGKAIVSGQNTILLSLLHLGLSSDRKMQDSSGILRLVQSSYQYLQQKLLVRYLRHRDSVGTYLVSSLRLHFPELSRKL